MNQFFLKAREFEVEERRLQDELDKMKIKDLPDSDAELSDYEITEHDLYPKTNNK